MNEYTPTYSLNTAFNSIQQTCPEALPLARRDCRFWERKKKKKHKIQTLPWEDFRVAGKGKTHRWTGCMSWRQAGLP